MQLVTVTETVAGRKGGIRDQKTHRTGIYHLYYTISMLSQHKSTRSMEKIINRLEIHRTIKSDVHDDMQGQLCTGE